MKVQSVSNEIVEMCAEGAFNVVEEMTVVGGKTIPWTTLPEKMKDVMRNAARRILVEGVTAAGFQELMGKPPSPLNPVLRPRPEPTVPPSEEVDDTAGESDPRAAFDDYQEGPSPEAKVFVATVKACYFCATGSRA